MKQGIGTWLEKNPKALADVDAWLARLAAGEAAGGQRVILAQIVRDHGCPHTDQTSICLWLRKHRKKATAKARKGAEKRRERKAKKARVAIPTFERSVLAVQALERKRDFVVTCAQNNTAPDRGFLKALRRYCAGKGAELLVIPMRYKNPTATTDPQEGDDAYRYWWADELKPHLVQNEIRPHPLLRIMAQVRIQATAGTPLSGRRDGRSKAASAIYGHPQMSMRTVPTPQEHLPKILYSTGSVTEKNYSRTDAGDMGEFHHSHGAVVVEVRGDDFHLREVNWDGKRFYDVDRWYSADGSGESGGAEALYMGDVHRRFIDTSVLRATFTAKDSIVKTTRPKLIVAGDIFDGYSISHHERGRKLTEAFRAERGLDCVHGELTEAAEWLQGVSETWAPVVVTPSNHDDFLMRWLQAGDVGVEPKNREVYAYLTHRVLKEARETGQVPDPFELFCRGKVGRRTRFLRTDESLQVKGVELGMHGHLGPNGSRGSARNLSRIGTRSIIGHSHSPCIWQGVYQVGTSSLLNLGYTSGPSSWFHTHALVHPNGRRQMLHIVGGKWRG